MLTFLLFLVSIFRSCFTYFAVSCIYIAWHGSTNENFHVAYFIMNTIYSLSCTPEFDARVPYFSYFLVQIYMIWALIGCSGIQEIHSVLLFQVLYTHVMACWSLLDSAMVQLEYMMQTVSDFDVELHPQLTYLLQLAGISGCFVKFIVSRQYIRIPRSWVPNQAAFWSN